jgi:TolB-like protein/Tfp pilus assembly protein PilF
MIFRFGDHVLDLDRLELTADGRSLKLQPQVFSLLAYLVQNRDRVVGKDEIFDAVWAGRIVSESTLNARINAARHALGDNGREQRMIRTFPRRGFRFMAETAEGDGAPPPGLAAPAESGMPRVAVLPFVNLSGDPEQEYFADGLTEDIIAGLSLWRSFPVIARNSTFTYKGQPVDVRRVSDELGASYVVAGSVRKSGSRVRISVQLIDGRTGQQVWAQRYDRELADIFDLQDELTHGIAALVAPELERAERRRIASAPPAALASWECYLKGYAHIYEHTKEGNEAARRMFLQAIALDPGYARAQTGLAFTYIRDIRFWPPDDMDRWISLFDEAARKAVALDEADSEARTMLARVHMVRSDFDAAIAECRRAVELNPHRAWTNNLLGNVLINAGRFAEGIPWVESALRLNPLDPRQHLLFTHLSLGHLGAGNYEMTVDLARDALRRRPDYMEPQYLLASAYGYLDKPDKAEQAIGSSLDAAKDYIRESRWYSTATKECILDGLRRAGLAD